MAYKLTQFSTYQIPEAVGDRGYHEFILSGRRSPLVDLPGGVWDAYGDDAPPRRGSVLVADCMLTATAASGVQSQLDTWQSLIGERESLERKGEDCSTHSVTARLINVEAPRSGGQNLLLPIKLTFETADPHWRGATASETVSLVTSTSPTTMTVSNSGNYTINDPIITISAGATAITWLALLVRSDTSGSWQTWINCTGTIASGESLVIDCGALTVEDNGSDAYADFSLNDSHLIDSWCELAPGANEVSFIHVGGATNGSISFAYRTGWA